MKKLIWVLGFLLVFTGTAMAGTADGLTPAEETVCDDAGLSGAPWGLCNAYCEAMIVIVIPQKHHWRRAVRLR